MQVSILSNRGSDSDNAEAALLELAYEVSILSNRGSDSDARELAAATKEAMSQSSLIEAVIRTFYIGVFMDLYKAVSILSNRGSDSD